MAIVTRLLFAALVIFLANPVYAVNYRVGIARRVITPQDTAFLSGYSGRDTPAKGVLHDLWAKALVLQEDEGSRIVIVTTDLLGLSHEISEELAKYVLDKYGMSRSQLLLNSSHTHSGPMVWPSLSIIADYKPSDQRWVSRYTHQLTKDLMAVIDMAMADLQPMRVSVGHGSVDFAKNRRIITDEGKAVKGVNPDGPVDHDVPVLKIESPDGEIKGILFGYACHGTTIFRDNFLFNGDYAGFAQIEIEKQYPGATAMFLMGCAGDQNPSPRGTIEIAEKLGQFLAGAVEKVLDEPLKPVQGSIRTDYALVDLEFRPFDLATYQKDVVGANVYLQRRAKLMLEAYNKGWNLDTYSYPVQAVRFGKDVTILALGGETVVEYSLKTKKHYAGENLIVAGYSNEVMCYIPMKHMLAEGGYETEASMIYYGMPGPFADNVEDKIFSAIHQVMRNVGAKK